MCNSMHYSVQRKNIAQIDNTGVISEQKLF